CDLAPLCPLTECSLPTALPSLCFAAYFSISVFDFSDFLSSSLDLSSSFLVSSFLSSEFLSSSFGLSYYFFSSGCSQFFCSELCLESISPCIAYMATRHTS